ncbi:hypothetical protein L345_02808 [Ophiophagus hannah]|uniref:Beta-defensin-like domain-containing protein n=1 Tax=Ophiophagus hannah TaxID=8665 RepID=V8P9Z6_OPHHA|nr:hypothetical protein L345_02808 [Ophiophagus hannah]
MQRYGSHRSKLAADAINATVVGESSIRAWVVKTSLTETTFRHTDAENEEELQAETALAGQPSCYGLKDTDKWQHERKQEGKRNWEKEGTREILNQQTEFDTAMKICHLAIVLFFAMLLVSSGNGERMVRFVSHCLRRGGICRYDDCSEGEEQIGTCYHHTMICCRDEIQNSNQVKRLTAMKMICIFFASVILSFLASSGGVRPVALLVELGFTYEKGNWEKQRGTTTFMGTVSTTNSYLTFELHSLHPCSSYSSLPDSMAKKKHRCKFDIGTHGRSWGNGRVGQQRISKSGASPESMPDCKELDGEEERRWKTRKAVGRGGLCRQKTGIPASILEGHKDRNFQDLLSHQEKKEAGLSAFIFSYTNKDHSEMQHEGNTVYL